jgi:hypothetical protein
MAGARVGAVRGLSVVLLSGWVVLRGPSTPHVRCLAASVTERLHQPGQRS